MKIIIKLFFALNVIALNARFLDVAIFMDKNQEANEMVKNPTYRGPITLDLGISLCQKNFPIITSASLLSNIQNFKKNPKLTQPTDLAIKSMPLLDTQWDIYKHRSGLLYLLIPKTYLNNLKQYNTTQFLTEALKYPQFLPQEILTGFRINPATGIFKKVSWTNLELEPAKYNAEYVNNWKSYDAKTKKDVNWLEIFTSGQDDIFGLWNISLDGHGSYATEIFKNPGFMPKSVSESSGAFVIAGLSLSGYRTFIQFLTDNIKTNFLHYTTCFGGDLTLFLPYITSLLNYKGNIKGGVKKPNFTIAAGALTSELVYVNSGKSLLGCIHNIKAPALINYKSFFNDLKKFSPNAFKAVIYNDKELREILLNVTDRVKTGIDPYGISGLPSVMFPNSEIFRAVKLDDKTTILNEVFLKKYLLAFKGSKLLTTPKTIVLKDQEVILIYPSVVPVEIQINSDYKKPAPAIVSMGLGMSLTKIFSLNTNISFYRFLNESIGAVNPVFNKYFFINKLTVLNDDTTKKLFGYTKNYEKITLKNVLILIKNDNGKRRYSTIFMTEDNKVYKIAFPDPLPKQLKISYSNTAGKTDFENSMESYFNSSNPATTEIKEVMDWKYLSKILSGGDKELFDKLEKIKKDSDNKLAKAKADKLKMDKLAADKIAKDKIATDKANQEKQFKTISDKLVIFTNLISQLNKAKANKKPKLVKQLNIKINQAKKNLSKMPINFKNNNGQTPLMLNPKVALILPLLDKNKANNTVNAKDAKGKTVLQYLIQSADADKVYIYRALINTGVKVTPKDIKLVQNKLKNKPKKLKAIIALLKSKPKK
ncbi:MAG: hypothetical protein P4L22_01300 [Candidatus Babeliales bacterium]|nr:hypothetical protein [Candidatus Babeliales bacterium]